MMSTEVAASGEEPVHSTHCAHCHSFVLCSALDEEVMLCPFVQCECGSVHHGCKHDEHLLLCPLQRVECINAHYGCPMHMSRENVAKHLQACPASLVVCNAEWNRWPIFAPERRKPFRERNPHAHKGQLDYELALRDARQVASLRRLSLRSLVTLRNSVTKRHVLLPISNHMLEHNNKGMKGDGDHDLLLQVLADSNNTNLFGNAGLQSDRGLSRQMQQWQEDLDERLRGRQRPPKYWDFPELEKGNVHRHCSHCFNVKCERTYELQNEENEGSCSVIRCKFECGAIMHACKSFEHSMICPNYSAIDESEWMFRGMSSARKASIRVSGSKAPRKLTLAPDLLSVNPGEPAFMEFTMDSSKSRSKSGKLLSSKKILKPPPMESDLHQCLGLSLRLDSMTWTQPKPLSVYTFKCHLELRRDEFSWHSQNVHSDIHGGLNNWLEVRCPLSVYGCSFSVRRLRPSADTDIVYSDAVDSFGVTHTGSNVINVDSKSKKDFKRGKKEGCNSNQDCKLDQLPYDVLELICHQLEPFSLSNLSLVSRYLRDVCSTLLTRRGCVSMLWKPTKDAKGNRRWTLETKKRWFFSTAMRPIPRWSHSGHADGAIANHMSRCAYNVKNRDYDKHKSKEYDDVVKEMANVFSARL